MSNGTYGRIRAFIVTPFETKNDSEGNPIDFDAVRKELIEPALDRLGVTGRTTGEIVRSGNIQAYMFQRLLTADLVVAEVSIHNANVYYELGIRHALRRRSTFMLRGKTKSDKYPFDIQGYRYLTYDRENPAASVDELVEALQETLDSTEQDSPVFRNLPALREQERSNFVPVPLDFREEVEQALADKQRGDLDLLAMETRGFEWGTEGLRVVGRAQFKVKDFEGARETWERVRADYPDDKEANTWLSTIHQKLGNLTPSDQALNRVVMNEETTPAERAEAYALMGRNAKVRWIQDWRQYPEDQHREQALRSRFLEESFDLYKKGFDEDLNHFYSGLNALAMLTVRVELATQQAGVWAENFDDEDTANFALATLKKQLGDLAPGILLSIKAGKERLQRDKRLDDLTWARISAADHCFLTSKKPEKVKAEYRSALTGVADFYSHSAGDQILLYRDLEILPENVAAALEIAKPGQQPAPAEQPHVFVFTGHRIDDEDRQTKRFPKEMEGVAREAIKEAIQKELAKIQGSAIGIAGGASGGDILFHEICAELTIPTQLYLALPRNEYIKESVQGAGPEWVLRFNKLYGTLQRRELAQSAAMPRWLREKNKYGIWQRNNLWVLSNAIALDKAGGGTNVTLIALWNGKKGDAPGGTEDMVEQSKERGARTIILPTEKLFGLSS